jgi:cytochrome d ubiquinol oxidase subunit I
LLNPFVQPDYRTEKEPPFKIGIPYGLSILATHQLHGYVPGVNDILQGYTKPDGTKELSAEEKIARGKKAILALSAYHKAKTPEQKSAALAVLKPNMKYFGYGYIKNVDELVPNIPLCFYAFRVMVGLGCLFILFFLASLFLVYKKDISKYRWFLILSLVLVPLAYIGSESGWLVAEMGRQPWTIQDMLPVGAAISDIQAGSVALTFFIFLLLFTTMLAVEISILCKQIKKGPEHSMVDSSSESQVSQ